MHHRQRIRETEDIGVCSNIRMCSLPTQAAAAPAEGELSTNMKAMQKFAEKYCEITDTFFCSDLDITATVIKGKLPRSPLRAAVARQDSC